MAINLSMTHFNELSAEDKRRTIIEGERKIARHSIPHLIERKEFSLPEDIIIEIFKFLSTNDLCNTANVNHCFRRISLMSSDYFNSIECFRLENCINRGINKINKISSVYKNSETQQSFYFGFKQSNEAEEHLKKYITNCYMPNLTSGKIECSKTLEMPQGKRTLNFNISHEGKITVFDSNNTIVHESEIFQIFPNFNYIYNAKQIGNIICLEVAFVPSEIDIIPQPEWWFHGFLKYIDLNKYIEPRSDADNPFNPFIDIIPEWMNHSNCMIKVFGNHLIVSNPENIHLYKLNHEDQLERIWLYRITEDPHGCINQIGIKYNEKVIFFTSNIRNNPNTYLHVLNIKDKSVFTYRYRNIIHLESLIPALFLQHHDITVYKSSPRTLLFLHKLNKKDVNGVRTCKELQVNGDIQDIVIQSNSDQFTLDIVYKTNSMFRRSQLKRLSISSDSLKPLNPNQRRITPFKLGCS